jgi:hypothetical protein
LREVSANKLADCATPKSSRGAPSSEKTTL